MPSVPSPEPPPSAEPAPLAQPNPDMPASARLSEAEALASAETAASKQRTRFVIGGAIFLAVMFVLAVLPSEQSSPGLRLLVGAPLLLMALTMIACYVPARKSIRIDPLKALREE